MSGGTTTLVGRATVPNPTDRTGQPRKRQRDYVGSGLWVALCVSALIWSVPFLFMFLTSVKSRADVSQLSTWELPTDWMCQTSVRPST